MLKTLFKRNVLLASFIALVSMTLTLKADDEEVRYTFTGTVVLDGSPPKPAEKVLIEVYRVGVAATSSVGGFVDAKGAFNISAILTKADYELSVTRAGFGLNRDEKSSPFAEYVCPRSAFRVTMGPEGPEPVHIVLKRGAAVHGRAVSHEGQPLPRFDAHTEPSGVGRQVKPDPAKGGFRISGIPTGSAQRVVVTQFTGELDNLRLMCVYVDVPAEKLIAGQTFELGDIRFPAMTGKANFRGRVMTDDGAILSIPLTLIHETQPIIIPTGPGADGQIAEREIPPGKYRVTKFRLEPTDPEVTLARFEIPPGGYRDVAIVVPKRRGTTAPAGDRQKAPARAGSGGT